jgi:hypothetical protein
MKLMLNMGYCRVKYLYSATPQDTLTTIKKYRIAIYQKYCSMLYTNGPQNTERTQQ